MMCADTLLTPRGSCPSVKVYTEFTEETEEIPHTEIVEYAKRIGIDLETEPHLKYLAEEGLLKPLPSDWKPCEDVTKHRIFYYNNKTNKSQWEHPLDEFYRQEVVKVRQEFAMNKLQEIELMRRPPRSLPPLKKLGNNRPATTPLAKLGPLGAATPNNGTTQPLNETPFQSNPIDAFGDLPTPSSRTIKKPASGGLLLTGQGANFLKGSKTSQLPPNVELVLIDDAPPTNSIKSILSTHRKGSASNSNTASKEAFKWMLNPDLLTDEEQKMLKGLNMSLPVSSKPAVKFQIDDNTEIKFDISTDENKNSEEESESDDDDDKSTSRSHDNQDLSDTPFNRSKHDKSIESQQKSLELSSKEVNLVGGGENVPDTRVNFETAFTSKKIDLKDNMEKKLKEYQDHLEREILERENQLKKQMELRLEEIRVEKESIVRKARQDFEQEKDIELEKVKSELESVIQKEVDKLKSMYEQELGKKKEDVRKQHESALDTLSTELKCIESDEVEDLQRKYSSETLKLHSELKSQKDILREEQRKQIITIKDYHASFTEKLCNELKEEEDRLQQEHQLRIAEIIETFEKENSELSARLKADQDSKLQILLTEFEKERSSMERELKEGLFGLRSDMNLVLKSDNPPPDDTSNEKHEELKVLKEKYHQLERKYGHLKKELRKISEPSALQQNSQKIITKSQNEFDSIVSDSPSDSTFYPFSPVKVNGIGANTADSDDNDQKDASARLAVDDFMANNSDRVATALKSLEILKTQILEIKKDQDVEVTSRKPPLVPDPKTTPIKKKKPISANNKVIKKNVPPNSARSTSSCGTIPNSNAVIRPSKSSSELPGLIEDNKEESPEVIVKEAKEFIRIQTERLNMKNSNNHPQPKFEKPISTTWSKQKFADDSLSSPKYSITNSGHNQSLKQNDMYSETESSGVGSLRDFKSREKKQISRDIEAICSSLSNLDEQMRIMWSVVQGESKTPINNSLLVNHSRKPYSAPSQSSSSRNNPTMKSADLQNYATACLSQNNRALMDSLKSGSSTGNQNATNGRRTTPNNNMGVTPTSLLNSLDRELKDFKAAKERILSQFSVQRNTSQTSEESIQEKTKDLREWLEKF